MSVLIGFVLLIIACAVVIAFAVYGLRAITFVSQRQFRKAIIPFVISFACACPFVFCAFELLRINVVLKESICVQNIATIRKALQLYANKHTNYPPDLQRLTNTLNMAGEFICPASGHKAGTLTNVTEWTDYYYIAGLKESDPRECLLAYCNCPKHKRSIVLKLDGAITLIKPKELEALANNFGVTNQALLAEIKSRAKIIRGTRQIEK